MDLSDSRVQFEGIARDPIELEAAAQFSAGPAAAPFMSLLPATARMEGQQEDDHDASQDLSISVSSSFASGSESLATPGAEVTADQAENTEGTHGKSMGDFMREQDRLMPIANIGKIMARQLAYTGHSKISEDTKRLMQECATEFICFIISEANDQATQAKRKAVSGQDIINACEHMEMLEMLGPLTNALPHLQPPKRLRGKAAEEAKALNPTRRRRCRVSDEEFERNQLSRRERWVV